MKIKQISIGVARTLNLGNFETLRVEGMCTVDIDEHDDLKTVRSEALTQVKQQMNDAYNAMRPK